MLPNKYVAFFHVKRLGGRLNSASRAVFLPAALVLLLLNGALCGCSMREEMKRIEAMKQAREASESSRSTNLTGEQIYIRSCNTCHPITGRRGMGPSLIDMDKHFPDDAQLKAFIRQGKGIMPGQPPTTLNDKEMSNLIDYLRKWNADQREEQPG